MRRALDTHTVCRTLVYNRCVAPFCRSRVQHACHVHEVCRRGGSEWVEIYWTWKWVEKGRNDSLPTHFDSVSTHFVRPPLAHPNESFASAHAHCSRRRHSVELDYVCRGVL
eukprot:5134792-Prymnesium_polylepis.1